jgi:hypothetical protein
MYDGEPSKGRKLIGVPIGLLLPRACKRLPFLRRAYDIRPRFNTSFT